MNQFCGPLYLVHTAHRLTPMAWIGNCVIAAVDALTPSRRAGTGTLYQIVILYHSLEYPQTEGGTDQETEREKVGRCNRRQL